LHCPFQIKHVTTLQLYSKILQQTITIRKSSFAWHARSRNVRDKEINGRPAMTRWLGCLLLLLLVGCATVRPTHPNNICAIFKEKRDWYSAAKDTQKKWGVPLQEPFAILYQESGFRENAKTPREHILWIIPWGRESSAFGYAQAENDVWKLYKRQTGNGGASREDFDDAMDFMGWYMDQTKRINGIPTQDIYRQYLNYHEGWGGYRRKTYERKPEVKTIARNVQARSELFGQQYAGCKADLDRGFWSRLWHSL
jgi:hypothetical protein